MQPTLVWKKTGLKLGPIEQSYLPLALTLPGRTVACTKQLTNGLCISLAHNARSIFQWSQSIKDEAHLIYLFPTGALRSWTCPP